MVQPLLGRFATVPSVLDLWSKSLRNRFVTLSRYFSVILFCICSFVLYGIQLSQKQCTQQMDICKYISCFLGRLSIIIISFVGLKYVSSLNNTKKETNLVGKYIFRAFCVLFGDL